MSIPQRKRLLELFFEEHSYLSNVDKIFLDVMDYILANTTLSLPGDANVEELLGNKKGYNADVTFSNQSFTVPWMTSSGTFIVNGVERVPLIQEVKAKNIIYTSSVTDNKGMSVICSTRFPDAKFPARLVLRSTEIYLDVSGISRQLEGDDDDDDDLHLKAQTKLSLAMLIDMFGSGVDVADTLGGMGANGASLSMLLSSMKPTNVDVPPSKDVLKENIFNLGMDDVELADDIIINTLLFMFNECVSVYFGKVPSDRDNYANKWLKSSGDIIGPIIADIISRKSTNFAKALDARLMSMMRTGNITIGKRIYPKMVVQVSKRSTFDAISSVRKIAIPCDENSAGAGMRQLHPSQNGFVCVSETPEGKTTGLNKSLALTCTISPKLDSKKILRNVLRWMKRQRKKIYSKDTTPSTPSEAKSPVYTRQNLSFHTSPITQRRVSLRNTLGSSDDEIIPSVNLSDVDKKLEEIYYDGTKYFRTWVVFDGIVIGYFFSNVGNGDVYEKFRDETKKKYKYVSISNPSKFVVEIRTWCGRPMRPLLKISDTSPVDWRKIHKCTWKELVMDGLVEYLDPSEANIVEDEIAALDYDGDFTRFKYMEIHPCTLFGVPASLIPFANHNQSARNIFASSMIKQAMQLTSNPSLYHEGKYLVYGQKPLVDTITADVLGLNENPNGVNLVVCVLAYTGYNMEDAIIVNKSSVDNGLFFSMVRNVYNKSTDGLVVYDDDEMLLLEDKVSAIKIPKQQTMFDGIEITRTSIPNPHVENGRLFVKNDEHRKLSVGDKIASRHAQKGVVGRIMDANDMPFTGDGIRPDIIFNPHGIPSRMTMGQLLEGVIGTQCAIDGSFFDGTSFSSDLDIDTILQMERDNSSELYSGMSGELMGIHHLATIYYMPLKHQSKDKVYVRWVGPNELFSRQPVAGKKKGGGLKFGEMEMDAMISHGAANAINDTIRQSDMCEIPVCKTCGLFPATEKECGTCHSDEMVDIETPYSLKVFADLCKCANMLMKVHL
jgi:DNA-directed RNA polymerase beta subunit